MSPPTSTTSDGASATRREKSATAASGSTKSRCRSVSHAIRVTPLRLLLQLGVMARAQAAERSAVDGKFLGDVERGCGAHGQQSAQLIALAARGDGRGLERDRNRAAPARDAHELDV